jgi:predicted transcriptional regulator
METELISETITKMRSGNRNRYTYFITPKGIEALNHYRLIKEALENEA